MRKDIGSPDLDTNKAELFQAISHPVRIKILEALDEKPLGFAELGRAVGIESGGHLSFHLTKLRHLIRTNSRGDYVLTAEGRDALRTVRTTAESPSASEVGSRQTKRIAILPFSNMGPNPNDGYLADGLTEELINRISLVRGLEVIARTSVMGFKKKDKKISEIGKELKVSTLLEGSVRKVGNRIRVSAQLIDANTEGHLWSESYDRNLEDIFEVQSSVAENVAGALQLKLLDENRERVESTDNVKAYAMYLRAMQLYHEGTETSCREAVALFEGAISRDPTFSRAYVGLAQAWLMMGPSTEWADFTTCANRAEAAARKALELVPGSAEAHAVMGAVHHVMDRLGESRVEEEKAIRIDPNLAYANWYLGVSYAVSGRFDESIRCYRKACSLDPLNPLPALWLTHVLRVAGRVDEALEMLDRLKELRRTDPAVYYRTALCYLQTKDFAKALGEIDAGLRFDPNNLWLRTARGTTYALLGKRDEALDELRGLMKDESESHRLYAQVWIRTALGDLDEAFKAHTRQWEIHSGEHLVNYDPLFEGLQKDPRFPEFCKKVGLPP